MTKVKIVIYWISTLWLSLGMISTAIVQLTGGNNQMDIILKLGYPAYFLILIGIWKLLGVVAILVPKFPLVKEWAYAGFFFAMSGAIFSHIAAEDPLVTLFGPSLLVVLTALSWYFRPADRKVSPVVT
jgi:hypothetical protein